MSFVDDGIMIVAAASFFCHSLKLQGTFPQNWIITIAAYLLFSFIFSLPAHRALLVNEL
jgi:hypothetical protein